MDKRPKHVAVVLRGLQHALARGHTAPSRFGILSVAQMSLHAEMHAVASLHMDPFSFKN